MSLLLELETASTRDHEGLQQLSRIRQCESNNDGADAGDYVQEEHRGAGAGTEPGDTGGSPSNSWRPPPGRLWLLCAGVVTWLVCCNIYRNQSKCFKYCAYNAKITGCQAVCLSPDLSWRAAEDNPPLQLNSKPTSKIRTEVIHLLWYWNRLYISMKIAFYVQLIFNL